ncbi:hypothetical protein KVV02_007985 [Mortierella alpina]|uniref:Uncharacterized protein n=1 Tax=Mortierella alpina TaxID=64518 RepID=A0A9P7ZYZ7_MORAP|nr:hypothetical protein KVV02_007985 [Mortierella alpina]
MVDKIVPSQSEFVLATMNKLLQYGNVDGEKFGLVPDNYPKARRHVPHAPCEQELAALRRYSLPTTDFSLMVYYVCLVYCGLMFKASGLEAWEGAGLLVVDTLYTDYWRSWSDYADEWDAYKEAADKITSVPDRVVELVKMSVLFNSCTCAIEQRSTNSGYPVGMQNVVNVLIYKSYESVSYGLAGICAYGSGLHCRADDQVFTGFLVILSHDVCEYVRDCYEENYSSTCMAMHGLGEDGFSVGCAVLFAVWNSLDCFEDKTARLLRLCISTSISGNLLVPHYCGKERLMECTSGEWSENVKKTAVDLVRHMSGVSLSWPEDVPMATVTGATYADYHRMAVTALFEHTTDQAADMCVEWANEIINSTVMRGRTVRYVKRGSTAQRGTWA